MKIVGLLCWYEEDPAWLAECVASAARLCDHLIAVDGPYAMFPGALRKPFSGSDQVDAIARTAYGAGMGVTIHTRREPWWGGEVEKRDFMFRLAETYTSREDWLLRIDADEVLTQIPPDSRQILADSPLDVAEVTIWERDPAGDGEHPFRCLFRALPGLRIEQAHYIVTAVDGGRRKVLRGNTDLHGEEPAEALWDVRLEHRTRQRPADRQRLKQQYGAVIPEIEPVSPFEENHGES